MKIKDLFFGSILFCCLPLSGFAADSKTTNDDSRTKVDVYLYFWPAGVSGDVEADNHTAHTNANFGDIFRNLKMGATGALKVSKNDWFVFNDTVYLDVAPKVSEKLPSGVQVNASLDNRVLVDMLAVGHQWQTAIPWNLFAGVHYFYGRVKLDATESLGSYSQDTLAVKSTNWFTPTIGGEVNLPITEQASLDFIADAGAASRSYNWEFIPTFFWKFNRNFAAAAGYRMQDISHREDDFKMDTLMQGPIVGVKITF